MANNKHSLACNMTCSNFDVLADGIKEYSFDVSSNQMIDLFTRIEATIPLDYFIEQIDRRYGFRPYSIRTIMGKGSELVRFDNEHILEHIIEDGYEYKSSVALPEADGKVRYLSKSYEVKIEFLDAFYGRIIKLSDEIMMHLDSILDKKTDTNYIIINDDEELLVDKMFIYTGKEFKEYTSRYSNIEFYFTGEL